MIRIAIAGMTCRSCVRHVREALAALPGVSAVEVDLERGEAEVESAAELSDQTIEEALEEEGYAVTGITRR